MPRRSFVALPVLFAVLALTPASHLDPDVVVNAAGPPPRTPMRPARLDVRGRVAAVPAPAAATRPAPVTRADTDVVRPRTVVEMQKLRTTSHTRVDGGGQATLVDLNPGVGAWLLLQVGWSDGRGGSYHLQNPDPSAQQVALDPSYGAGLVITEGKKRVDCPLWPEGDTRVLRDSAAAGRSWVPLCDGRLYLRSTVEGHRTRRERVSEFLRDHVWEGETITTLVKETFFKDAWRLAGSVAGRGSHHDDAKGAPPHPSLAPDAADTLLEPMKLGLPLAGADPQGLAAGRWYAVAGSPGVYAGAIRPDLVSDAVVRAQGGRVAPLDEVESQALEYLVSFDLSRFDMGFAVGTEHPRVGWSDEILPAMRDPRLAGPDGIGSLEPLARPGMLNPSQAHRAAAAFIGGFKRQHGAFHAGELASVNHGSHYGFVEDGVVLSRLQPGLATVVVRTDGRVEMKTWSRQDDASLADVRYARQNGVPILAPDPVTGQVQPDPHVRQWAAGNWSGSADSRLRTLRAGLCLVEDGRRRFLTYGYFSGATPSAMARVFQAYGCSYAMLLDMNALEHTYLAVYGGAPGQRVTHTLIDDMAQVDGVGADGRYLARFVDMPDNRDFFFLLRREP